MKNRTFAIGITLVVFLALIFASCQRESPSAEASERKVPEAALPANVDAAPPRDFSAWRKEYGEEIPDSSTSEGQSKIKSDREKLPEALAEFWKMMDALPDVYTNKCDAAEESFLINVNRLLQPFARSPRSKILLSIKWGTCGKTMEAILRRTSVDKDRVLVVERYYRISCALVDMLWTRAGMEYEAAEADYKVFLSLQARKRFAQQNGFSEVDKALTNCLDEWKRLRCDSERSNFCRSHLYWEERYRLYYEKRVQKGERNWLTFLSDRYRFHLSLAREILGRDPQWAPNDE